MPSRRTVLAGIAALLAGCGGPRGGDTVPPTDTSPEQSPRELTTGDNHSTSSDCGEGITVTADPFDPAEELPMRLSEKGEGLVGRAIENDGAEGVHYSHAPPIEDGSYAEIDGRFYRLAVEQTGQSEVPGLELNVEMDEGREAPTGATLVQFGDLPAVDQAALRYSVHESEYESREGLPRGLSVRDRPVPYPDGFDDSQFAATSGPLWVGWQGRDWKVEAGEQTTRTRYTFGVTPTEVAADADAFRSAIEETYLVGQSQFDAEEREILRAAADDGYEECGQPSPALSGLQERLEGQHPLPAPFDDSWYVALEDGTYQVELFQWEV